LGGGGGGGWGVVCGGVGGVGVGGGGGGGGVVWGVGGGGGLFFLFESGRKPPRDQHASLGARSRRKGPEKVATENRQAQKFSRKEGLNLRANGKYYPSTSKKDWSVAKARRPISSKLERIAGHPAHEISISGILGLGLEDVCSGIGVNGTEGN